MRRLSDDILFQMLKTNNSSSELWNPRIDIYETWDMLVIKAAIPGLNINQVELTLSEDGKNLNIKGQRNESDDTSSCRIKYHQLEIYYGNFERNILIPKNIYIDKDNISATYKNGMLIVTLTKKASSSSKSILIED